MDNTDYKSKSLPFFGIPKLAPFIKPYKKKMALMVMFGIAVSVLDVLLPQFQRYAINHITDGVFEKTIVTFVVLYVTTVILECTTNYLSCLFSANLEISIARDLRNACFDHLQTLSFTYYNQNGVGYIHSRVMSDNIRIGEVVSWELMGVVWNMSYVIGTIAVMFATNVTLTLLVITVIPVVLLMFSIFQKKLVFYHRKIREINSKITGNFNEGITGAKTIKALVVEDKMINKFNSETQNMRRTSINHSKVRGLFASTIVFASSFALAVVLWRGGILTNEGVMELGTYSVFMSYSLGIVEPIRWLVDSVSGFIMTQVNIERVTRLLSISSDVNDTEEVIKIYGDTFETKKENWEPLKGDIEFKDVSFMYPDGKETVLEHFNLKIPQGTTLAIVGETGAGKSTLANLVCRFYEPTEGQVLIDGRDARERSQQWLHSNMGFVLQTPHLFSGTILDNIRFGKLDATEEEVMEALKSVSAEGIVEKAEKGLYTDVGEGGDFLSTGEKQLISFARAIIADPRILILDEATASVDTLTEQKIQNAITSLIKDRTTIMIAHRLSTVVNADMILVVSNGKIIEQGTHRELMKRRGHYYDLYMRQYDEDAVKSTLG